MCDLVTGATGFIGSHLTRALVERGREVRILTRSACVAPELAAAVEVVRGDLTDPHSLAPAVAGVDRVFHCAAVVADWGDPAVFRRTNVQGVANLLAASRDAGINRFVHLSTTDVYGFPDAPVDEWAGYRYRGWAYGDTKIDGERLVWQARGDGLPVTVIRPANVYGVGSRSFVQQIAEALKAGQMIHLGRREPAAGLCHVENLVDCILRAAAHPASVGEVYNVLDDSPMSWRAFVNGLADAIGTPRPRITLPRRVAYAAAGSLEMLYRARRAANRPLLTRMAVEIFTSDQSFRIDKARRELGFEPRHDVASSLPSLARWLEGVAA